MENTVAHYGRAAHLDVNQQMIAHFGANQVMNARTWQRHPDSRKPWRFNMSRPPED